MQTPNDNPEFIQDNIQIILSVNDDWLRYRDIDKYNRTWQKRCGDCLAPCCFLGMQGFPYDYTKKDGFDEMSNFFTNDFVIWNVRKEDWSKNAEDGFRPQLGNEELNKLQICPLNVLGNCTIYEGRPQICRNWKCEMKLDRNLGVK